jgi:hypothetical protein
VATTTVFRSLYEKAGAANIHQDKSGQKPTTPPLEF